MADPTLKRTQGLSGPTTMQLVDASFFKPHDPVETTYRVISAATTNGQVISTLPGHLIGVDLYNTDTTSPSYVKFFDLATVPNLGTDIPVMVFTVGVSASGGRVTLGGDQLNYKFKTGIAMAITKLPDDTDATALTNPKTVVGTILF